MFQIIYKMKMLSLLTEGIAFSQFKRTDERSHIWLMIDRKTDELQNV